MKKNYLLREKLRSFFYLFAFLMIIWFALVSSINFQKILAGMSVSLILAFVLNEEYLELDLPPIGIKRIFYFIVYIFILLKEIVKANLDVAYRVIHPKMPIRPGVVVIKTNLKSKIGKLILANSITLTPGTFTLDIIGDNLLIHWINVEGDRLEERTKAIGERFEKILRKIFE